MTTDSRPAGLRPAALRPGAVRRAALPRPPRPPHPPRRAAPVALALALVLVLGGCAARPGPEQLVPRPAPEAGMATVHVLAMTDRASSAAAGPPVFGSERGLPAYESLTIAVAAPVPGPDGPDTSAPVVPDRDLARDFTTLGRQPLDAAGFTRALAREGGPGSAILVFVHGYNYSYQEAVFQLAELSLDQDQDIVPVLFSWPSQGRIRGYLADQDAATYARDDLAGFLATLAGASGGREVIVIGHSMGGWLVMEALRQLRLERREAVIGRLQVGLVAPDIDMDVFRAQTAVIGPLSPALMVMVSPDDRALGLSRRLSTGRPRLGAISVGDPRIAELVIDTGISVVDITSLPAADALNHNRVLALAALGSSISRKDEAERLQHAGAYILDVSGALLTAPFRSLEMLVAARAGGS